MSRDRIAAALRWTDRFTDRKLERDYLEMFAQLGCKTVADIRRECAAARERGLVVFPPCDRTKPNGHCAGHQVEEDEGDIP